MEKWLDHWPEYIRDEEHDMEKYKRLSEEAHGCAKQILKDMAHEEEIHAKMLRHIWDKYSAS